MKTNIPQLRIETHDDGTIDLEQNDGAGKIDRISLHPIHVRHLFEIAGHLFKPERLDVPARIATLERRLLWMKNRFNDLGMELPIDFYERCGSSLEFAAWVDASCAVADEYCADLPGKHHRIEYAVPSALLAGDAAKPIGTPSQETTVVLSQQLGLDLTTKQPSPPTED